MTALIVDDEIDICELLSVMLKKEGLQCKTFQSVAEGLDDLKDQQYDLAFLDLSLPDGSGIDLVKYINKNHPRTRIFMISAHDAVLDQQKAFDAGVEAFISKPFTKSDILNTIKNV